MAHMSKYQRGEHNINDTVVVVAVHVFAGGEIPKETRTIYLDLISPSGDDHTERMAVQKLPLPAMANRWRDLAARWR